MFYSTVKKKKKEFRKVEKTQLHYEKAFGEKSIS